MNKFWSEFISMARSLLVIVLGFIAVLLVNYIGEWFFKSILHDGSSVNGLPQNVNSQLEFLSVVFIAGVTGAFVVALLAHRAPWIHLWIFFGLGIIMDIVSILGPLSELPLWVKIIILVSIPAQVWIGGKLGMMLNMNS